MGLDVWFKPKRHFWPCLTACALLPSQMHFVSLAEADEQKYRDLQTIMAAQSADHTTGRETLEEEHLARVRLLVDSYEAKVSARDAGMLWCR